MLTRAIDQGSERSARRGASAASTAGSGVGVVPRRVKSDLSQPPLTSREFRRLVDGQLSEKEWQKQLEEALDLYGWWWMHIPANVIVCRFCHRKNYRGI